MDSAPLETELVVPERPPRRRCRCFQCPPCNSCRCRVALAAGLLLFCALVGLITAWVIRPNSVEYSEDTAVRLAQLAGAAYCSRTALEAWTCGSKCLTSVSKPVKVCQGETTQAFVARWEGDALISFEGTKSYLSMVQDLRIWKNLTDWKSHGKVHEGFLIEWESLRRCVKDALTSLSSPAGSHIKVTGHSLGGAVGVIAMVDLVSEGWLVREGYTFGMPRPGDAAFARTFDGMFFRRFYRVTHHMDPVPHVPPEEMGFQHLASEVFYDADVKRGFVRCPRAEDERCAGKYWDVPHDLLHISDHKDYMDQDTGSEGCEVASWVQSDQQQAPLTFA